MYNLAGFVLAPSFAPVFLCGAHWPVDGPVPSNSTICPLCTSPSGTFRSQLENPLKTTLTLRHVGRDGARSPMDARQIIKSRRLGASPSETADGEAMDRPPGYPTPAPAEDVARRKIPAGSVLSRLGERVVPVTPEEGSEEDAPIGSDAEDGAHVSGDDAEDDVDGVRILLAPSRCGGLGFLHSSSW